MVLVNKSINLKKIKNQMIMMKKMTKNNFKKIPMKKKKEKQKDKKLKILKEKKTKNC